VAFNTVVIDLIFYGFVTLEHSRGLSWYEITATTILLFLVIFDLCEIWTLTSCAVINETHFDIFNHKNKLNVIHPKEDNSELMNFSKISNSDNDTQDD
jgi:hypothetical protein